MNGDAELSAWAQSLIIDGLVKGFTPIVSRAQLTQGCTMIGGGSGWISGLGAKLMLLDLH